jgi:hypothetical protein
MVDRAAEPDPAQTQWVAVYLVKVKTEDCVTAPTQAAAVVVLVPVACRVASLQPAVRVAAAAQTVTPEAASIERAAAVAQVAAPEVQAEPAVVARVLLAAPPLQQEP